jgi:hypothetical protein
MPEDGTIWFSEDIYRADATIDDAATSGCDAAAVGATESQVPMNWRRN